MATMIRRRPTAVRPALAAMVERRSATGIDPLENVRLFATAWAGGMIFFATFLS